MEQFPTYRAHLADLDIALNIAMRSVVDELPRIRFACYCISSAGTLLLVLCCLLLVLSFFRGGGTPQFPYEATMLVCAAIYFFGVAQRAVKAARLTQGEGSLPLLLHYLSQCVIAFFVPLAIAAGYLVWSTFQPTY